VASLSLVLSKPYSWKNLGLLFLLALILRAGTFYFFVQHNEFYKQPDSNDYHICAISIIKNLGMHTFKKNPINSKISLEPIFWRTPGYPVYLSWFYAIDRVQNYSFSESAPAQKASIWLQIILCSCIPILTFFLALLLTNSLSIAWSVAWIFVFHIGFILASCYLLTDSLSMLFFLLFLIFFYKGFRFMAEIPWDEKYSYFYLIIAAINLALYTWMRPNGKFIAYLALFILLFCQSAWQKKIVKLSLFMLTFFACIAPWYIRNHTLTGTWFFCPMSGPYLQTFSAPKILRRLTNLPLGECNKYLLQNVFKEKVRQDELKKMAAPYQIVPIEFICGALAWPWIKKHPFYFLIDWMKEICKTSFDLYASQIVAMVKGEQSYDPPEEFLTIKLKECLYAQPMPIPLRLLSWLELLFSLFIWIGLVGGFLIFLVAQLFQKNIMPPRKQTGLLWIKVGLMVGGIIGMTGGFGYARLRMPAEALMIILSLTFWFWLLNTTKTKEITR
jgi:hypothetical protein